jgi:hypothetical protein
MMDSMAREVLALILDRLRQFEKTRLDDEAEIAGLRAALSLSDKKNYQAYKAERDAAVKRQEKDPVLDLDSIYVGLIDILKSHDQTEEQRQGRIRRLFESHEGPIQ